ncbi:myosin light chain kinase family member 4 [Thalassophryne amazonica]|uniref:myosin light chain kinase family member 4 n=1 Tax=Thalassophryne amazonica TaxID=390379 RepID=UPI001471A013|nr:myosin light chain kinase family member 4 [Thalassophryne amazonica]
MSSSLVNSLAKVYDPNPLHGQKSGGRKTSLSGSDRCLAAASSSPLSQDATLHFMENRIDSLSSQMERLLSMQQTVLFRLDGLSQDVRSMSADLASLREEGRGNRSLEAKAACMELRGAIEKATDCMESHGCRLDGVEKLVEGTQQVIGFIGEVVKSSRLIELLFKRPGNRSNSKTRDDKLSLKGLKVQQKQNPPDITDVSTLNDPVLREQLEKLNWPNTEHSEGSTNGDGQQSDKEDEGYLYGGSESEEEQQKEWEKTDKISPGQTGKVEDDGKERCKGKTKVSVSQIASGVIPDQTCKMSLLPQESKRCVPEEHRVKDDLKKSRVEHRKGDHAEGWEAELTQTQVSKSDDRKIEEGTNKESAGKEFMIDRSLPEMAPFDHRIVTPKPHQITSYYTINKDEVLGGGRFGQVHKCTEKSSGLTFAAKIVKARSQKEKEVVRNEIQVMNQLHHANLIQLYAAFESRTDIILIMEYVEGGELFDRIIDENYNLTELDTVLFIRQICEGLQYMHKMYILHLDLKPENILCVNRATNKIKIIDFGLARRYKPREKLRVNFGTPEFLAPEVINYEFVSFPTDMWSLGVITYMLLSGLSPFLGEDDNETLNNILACQWNFEEQEFLDISEQAKDFITRLLVKSKSWRMSAAESLKHPWLSDPSLHYQLNQKKNKCHSSHGPPPPET